MAGALAVSGLMMLVGLMPQEFTKLLKLLLGACQKFLKLSIG
jgi:hypothetical protein